MDRGGMPGGGVGRDAPLPGRTELTGVRKSWSISKKELYLQWVATYGR